MSQKTFLQPLESRLLVQVDDPAKELAGGLVLPESAQERSTKATVVAIGPDVPQVPQISIGTRVLVARSAGVEIQHEGKSYVLVRYSDCYAII